MQAVPSFLVLDKGKVFVLGKGHGQKREKKNKMFITAK